MARKHTASFVLELPLKTDPADERACAIILDAGRNIGNAVLGEGLRRLDLMRELRAYRAARKMSRGEPRSPAQSQSERIQAAVRGVWIYRACAPEVRPGMSGNAGSGTTFPVTLPKRRPRGPLMRSCNMHLASVGAPSSGVGIGPGTRKPAFSREWAVARPLSAEADRSRRQSPNG
jgi:hypothetical protein